MSEEEVLSPHAKFNIQFCRVMAKSLANNPDYVKCPRCWHYTHEGKHNYDNLCDRCCTTIINEHPEFNVEVTNGILKMQEEQRIKYTLKMS
jgi:hypothetical protein